MKKKIYLACPYWHENPRMREARFVDVSRAAGMLMKLGYIVFSPISHSHPISLHMGDKQDHDFWLEQDYAWLDNCDAVWVLALDGWKDSFGVKEEVFRAIRKNKELKVITMSEVKGMVHDQTL